LSYQRRYSRRRRRRRLTSTGRSRDFVLTARRANRRPAQNGNDSGRLQPKPPRAAYRANPKGKLFAEIAGRRDRLSRNAPENARTPYVCCYLFS